MRESENENGNWYEESYGNIDVHLLMLRDGVRNWCYAEAVRINKNEIKGKVVMDIGGGTALLSIFAARAGAKKIWCIEQNENLSILAKRVVQNNGYDNIITVVN
eukprot:Trichotokara_eunicae@DN180_c0_g1_i1.p1